MAIEFDCPYCTAPIRVPDSAAGKRGTCPRCRTGILVPKVKAKKKKRDKSKPESSPQPQAEPVAEKSGKPKKKKRSLREKFADEPDFTDFEGVGQSTVEAPVEAQASAPPPVSTSASTAPPPVPPHAAPVATPIAKSLRRRRRKSYLWVPILFGAMLVGGVVLFFLLTAQPKLEGGLPATVVPASKLEARLIRAGEIPVGQEKVTAVLRRLEENPLYPDQFTVSATDAGLQVRVKTTASTALYEVNIGDRRELLAYFDKNADRLEGYRRREFESGLKTFFEEAGTALEKGEAIPDDLFQQFHNRALANACIDVKGYHLVATLSGKAHYCFYQQGNRLYYLLPKGTRTFRIRGRRLPDGEVRVKANYVVTVDSSGSPARPVEPDEEPEPNDEGNAADDE